MAVARNILSKVITTSVSTYMPVTRNFGISSVRSRLTSS